MDNESLAYEIEKKINMEVSKDQMSSYHNTISPDYRLHEISRSEEKEQLIIAFQLKKVKLKNNKIGLVAG